MSPEFSDRFEIVNGPEDGIDFPITRTPIDVGADPACGIFLSIDKAVRPVHARISVVSGGYRVRSISGAPVLVDGKRSGVVLARIVRSGGMVRIGDTTLCLLCEPDGLADRSLGVPLESNLAWLIRLLLRGGWQACIWPARLLLASRGVGRRWVLPLLALFAIAALLRPDLASGAIAWIRGWLR